MQSARETITRRGRAAVALAALAATAAASASSGPGAERILSPRFFPVWQARNVAFPFVLREPGGRYRMYYAGSGAAQLNESAWDQWMTGVATSADLRDWSFPEDYEPVLPARRFFEGEVVGPARAQFDSMGAFGVSVLREGARWRLWYTGWNGDLASVPDGPAAPSGFHVGHATSRDGLAWTRHEGPVLSPGAEGSPDSAAAGQPHVVRDGAQGLSMWYEASDGRTWRICAARSQDGLLWSKEGVALEPGGPGAPDELGARNPVVVRRRGRWEMWYQGRARSAPAYRVLRAVSEDGRSWTKVPEPIALQAQPPLRGEEAVHVDSVLVEPSGACRVFYARQVPTQRTGAWGEGRAHSFHIFTERVDP